MSPSWDWPGSRWWKLDLHSHTPASYDFRPQADVQAADWEQWLKAARDAGVHAIAITDHNTAQAVGQLQDIIQHIDSAPVLFPGVELTADDGSHLLLLFDPACKQEHVEDLLSKASVPVDHRGSQVGRSSMGVEQILEACAEEALVVGAHVNGCDGLLSQIVGQQRIAVLRHSGLAAVEIDPGNPVDENWLNGSIPEIGRHLSQVWSSDGHRHNELGRRYTWVKMTVPNSEGLRLAFLDGVDSLKPATRHTPNDPNVYADLAIESITVRQGQFIGRSSPFAVGFNPWLNAIIGGRGTGKSTLVDFCRKTLRREAELDGRDGGEEGSLRSFFDRRMRVPESRSDEGLLTADTLIEIIYRKAGQRFVLSWSQNGKAQPIARLEGDIRTPQEGEIRERFPLRVYSQKQLYDLAQDPNALLAFIDDSPIVRGAELHRSIEQLAASYLSLWAQSRAARNRASGLPARRAALQDVQHKLAVLQEGGHAQVLNEYRMRRHQDEAWQAILREAVQAVEAVEHGARDLTVPVLELSAAVLDDKSWATLGRAHEALKNVVEALRRRVYESVEKIKRDIEEIQTGADALLWQEAVEASGHRFGELSAKLAAEGISDPNEYNVLLEQAADLLREIEDLELEEARAMKLDGESLRTLVEYRRQREALTERRRQFMEENSGGSIRVEIRPYANPGNVTRVLRDVLGIGSFTSDRQAISRKIRPEKAQPWDWKRLDGVVADMRRFLADELDSWETQDRRFESALKRVPPERIDRLQLFLPEDAVEVSFKDGGGVWRPLAQGSPGQQTAALLAFVLGYGTEPIILDQPEDDLDSILIYELLVKRLRETKLRRQVIVVTHNHNIVVHGDAELVLSLEAAAGQTHIVCQGGLQERLIRDEICRVMEGGREAFERRYHRIMPPKE